MELSGENPARRLFRAREEGVFWDGMVSVGARTGEETIHVSAITASASILYERMRSLLDNKEQHVVRWHTIYRILNRLMRLYDDDRVVATRLLRELVEDGFLPNGTIPVSASQKIQYVLLKYRVLRGRFPFPDLFRIAVSEVETMLYGNRKEVFVRALYETVRNEALAKKRAPSNEHEETLLYLACRKEFLEDDEAGLLYGVWMVHFPGWETLTDIAGKETERIPSVLALAKRALEDTRYRKMARTLRDISISFLVLRELIDAGTSEFLDADEVRKRAEIRLAADRLSATQYRVARTMGVRAFWYVCITKTAIILPVEYALTVMLFPPVEIFPLLINLVFHPLVLLMMTRTMREPKRVNADMIVSGVERIVSGESTERTVDMFSPRETHLPYRIAYGVLAIGVFSLLIWALLAVGFTPVNIVFFLVLLGIISFFAFRVRAKARRFTLRRYDEMYPSNFWFSLATIPFIDAGRRLSDGFRAINVFTEAMDLFIEVPFKTFMRVVGTVAPFLEKTVFRVIDLLFLAPFRWARNLQLSFLSFVKERKEEIS